ncbi:hypothetical protein OJF2_62590 [Aquisphaera giovannonii]|uniref:SbsA Ig-like domain-containing protein n=1 Tax=Aquisphaera giovannonii TaxID=406548 RepID=A0A5B9WAJ1_9BACT|nr:DVUA0089 family protein [Aquisphaera giovannonii]QEH37668.1 hypothetical protein OJF2_62590 [Aquisphaera giovannonii]
MSRSPNAARRPSPRRRPRLDPLERRLALSGGIDPVDLPASVPSYQPAADPTPPADVALTLRPVTPADGAVLTSSPDSLVLEFNRPVFPDTVQSDVVLVRLDDAGNYVWAASLPPIVVDPSATRLTVPLDVQLSPGRYRLWVPGSSSIMDLDGNYLTDGVTDLVLGEFEVTSPRLRLSDATELGTPGSAPTDVVGSLDFGSPSTSVALYRVELAAGHFWRLGVESTAQRDGGALDSALALFDEGGRLISSQDAGRPDAPKDPFLFAGLQPGTYYIGVSGVGNLPDLPGGYDPLGGSYETVTQAQPGGLFTLHVVADAVDSPPAVLGLTLDHADPIDPAPTGLTLAFSRVIAGTSQLGDRQWTLDHGIEVVDGTGHAWPVRALSYPEEDARITYLFDRPLPPGHYAVRLPDRQGLTDLAGLSPVASGLPPGELGQFDVPARQGPRAPGDLGAMLPQAAIDGVSIDLSRAASQADSYRFVVTVPGLYVFRLGPGGGPAVVRLQGQGVNEDLSAADTNDTQLSPGVYTIRLQGPTAHSSGVTVTFGLASDPFEVLLANGVGQGPGLSLRLIARTAPEDTPADTPAAPGLAVGLGPLPGPPDAGRIGPAPLAGSSPPPVEPRAVRSIPSQGSPSATTTFIGAGGDLAGRPSLASPTPDASGQGAAPASATVDLRGALPGQSLNAWPLGPARLSWGDAGLADRAYGETATATIAPSLASLDVRGAIDSFAGIPWWAARQGRSLLEWAGLRRGSSRDAVRIQGRMSDGGLATPEAGSDPTPAIGADESSDDGGSPGGFAPHLVVVSVVAIAQGCRCVVRWAKGRANPRLALPPTAPDASLAWDRTRLALYLGSRNRAG